LTATHLVFSFLVTRLLKTEEFDFFHLSALKIVILAATEQYFLTFTSTDAARFVHKKYHCQVVFDCA
jgi:hypothetical protein